jgi:hypothetical protein
LLLFSVACGTRAFVVPAAPGVPAPEGLAAWAEARRECQDVQTYRAGLRMSGKIPDARRIPAIAVGVAISESRAVGLSGQAIGRLLFTLKGDAERATLLLHEGNRVVTARAAELTDALIGVPLSPQRLLGILTGCVADPSASDRVEQVGDLLRVTTQDATVFLASQPAGWVVRAALFERFAVDYQKFDGRSPLVVRITTAAGLPAAELSLSVQEVIRDEALPPGLLDLVVPDGATPITLEELREGL